MGTVPKRMPPEVAENLRRAQDGDLEAFDALISEHLGRIRRFTRGFAGHEQDADDLAQEVMLKVYLSIRSFRGRSSFSTWLFRVARNVCIDASRSRWGQARRREQPIDASTPVEIASEQESALVRQEVHARIWDALRRLPLRLRTPVILYDIEELSYEAVANIERIPVGTVRSRLFRGRRRLREMLGETDGSEALPAKKVAT